ncbi:MAG: anthranilate phosphoribosyltransferase [Xanthomonadales bacterium]|nr:anthranilate phosphoribosyltransferase [Xanthomonadales bacterium]NIN59005.1 anthranilate phosphoribosyltransferase [Xanthomonadales bacterium]NIN74338.1 anthranilate phosphoribosyltransferase [Xanthomonadales bacterium]NIO13159.1 anthranilate phosphoribosyltransferase [Xanthomonadales bacterium]NIP11398.1 anthranilate phosphoribosyltransferase [Xanthomonadales bacterium]
MDIQHALGLITRRQDLSTAEMASVMHQIMSGQASDAQIGAFLAGMRIKGETIDEIVGAVTVMRELALDVEVQDEHLVDIVGTGGDGANLFNVSTAAALVVAAAGGRVAKHGNRSVSSRSGSADVLEAAGVRLDLTPEQVAQCVHELGIGFMFAPAHHSAMKHAVRARQQLGMRTLFNILGPMTNPAGVRRMLIGVYDKALCRPVAEVLGRLGAEHVMVVHANDGLDEISVGANTWVAELREGELREYEILPEDFGIARHVLDSLVVADSAASLKLVEAALRGAREPAAEKAARMIALNSGAAIYVAGLAESLAAGVETANEVIRSGAAWQRLQQLVELSNRL